jgi:uncharacterized protein YodC (DUF2158 family)
MNLKVGDVVYSKSGGPKMTVANITANGIVCQWFEDATLKAHQFDPATLVTIPD